jgi:hypothetical protein
MPPGLELRIVECVRRQEQIYPADSGFLEAVQALESTVHELPNAFSLELAYGDPGVLWPHPTARVLAALESVDSRLNYTLYVAASIARSLLRSIVGGLNEGDYLRCLMGARATLEFAADVHGTVPGVVTEYSRLDASTDDHGMVSVLAATLQGLDKFVQPRQFDWRRYIDSGLSTPPSKVLARQQKNMERRIGALPQESPGSLYAYYRLLCDFVHPSLGMQNLFITHVEVQAIPNGKWATYHLSRDSAGEELLWLVLRALCVPTRDSMKILALHIEDLRRLSLEHRAWLGARAQAAAEG